MRRLLRAVVAFSVLFLLAPGLCPTARASWIFGKSYYSHDAVRPTTVGDRHHGGPYSSPPQGVWFRSGYRYINGTIYSGGGSYDREIIREGYYQFGVQH